MTDSPRCLVIGRTVAGGPVTSYSWDKAPLALNIADYDKVLLDLTTYPRDVNGKLFAPDKADVISLLFSGGDLVIVGSPFTRFYREQFEPAHWLLPGELDVSLETGTAIKAVVEQVREFFSFVRQWQFSVGSDFKVHPAMLAAIQRIQPRATTLSGSLVFLAETRYGRGIGFALGLAAMVEQPASSVRYDQSNNLLWLPAPAPGLEDQAISAVLTGLFGLGEETAPPSWASEYRLPETEALAGVVNEVEAEYQSAAERLRDAQERLAHSERFRRVLYETGVPLETAVIEALHELGGEFQAVQPGREDFRITAPSGHKFMGEVKGKAGQIGIRELRQLDHWVRDAEAEEEWSGKGVLVGNGFWEARPEERETAFSDQVLRKAADWGYALLSTTTLFEALRLVQLGLISPDRFWKIVLESNGEVALSGGAPEPLGA